jgi:hypothetical protein
LGRHAGRGRRAPRARLQNPDSNEEETVAGGWEQLQPS